MKWLILLLIFVLSLSIVLADDPPALSGFQEFYGSISNLPDGITVLKAKMASRTFEGTIAADKTYGYNPTFKVSGSNGQLITFVVVNSLGVETVVGNATYRNNAVTELNLAYPSITPADDGTDTGGAEGNRTGTDDSTDSTTNGRSTRSSRSGTGSTSGTSAPLPAGSCLQSWVCRGWSECSNGLQTRTCEREDQCDKLKAAGSVTSIVTVPKPAEQRTCQSGTGIPAPVTGICSPSAKRCLGKQLQQCSIDGRQWTGLELCPERCDSYTLQCAAETPIPPEKDQKPSSVLLYYIGGSVLLLAVIILLVFFFLERKKYSPVKTYISDSRNEGYSDGQIRQALVSEGWDEKKVEKFLK